MSNYKLNVILLKSEDSSKEKDRYVELLNEENIGNRVNCVNLLKFDYCNLDKLYERLKGVFLNDQNSTNTNLVYNCLILTSKQAVESIEFAFKEIDSLNSTGNNFKWTELKDRLDVYDSLNIESKLIVYCVGEATMNRFKKFVESKLNRSVINRLILRREQTKNSNDDNGKTHKQNAKVLASLIIDDYNYIKLKYSDSIILDKYALYPCSSIRKDDLSNELAKEGVCLDELTAYKTVMSESGISELNNLIDIYLNDEYLLSICLVFFSPSGCEFVFNGSDYVAAKIKSNLNKFKLISIGPSTTSKLKQSITNSEFSVYELDEPSPKALASQLKKF